jgi:hypothetical protein
MRRRGVAQVVSDLVGFAQSVAARMGASKSVEVQLKATDDDSGENWCELWGHAPLLYRPVAGAEQLYVELGDERVVFATKDRRWQIDVADGEVVVRAMGADSPAYVQLKPDGACVISATSINLGGDATAYAALASLVDARLSAVVSWLNAHVHTSAAPSSPTTTPTVPLGAQASVAATKVKAK